MKKLFGTDGVRGEANIAPMTVENALRLGLAVGSLLKNSPNKKVVIGKDTRLSGYMFESALTAGLCAFGLDVHQLGVMPTPAVAYLTKNMNADLGIVISASHNKYQDNGIKFFDKNGYKLSDAMEEEISSMVLNVEQDWDYVESQSIGRVQRILDASGRYLVYVKNSFSQNTSTKDIDLQGINIVIDCANGANYKIAPLALKELGAEVHTLATSPNGTNINANCGSLHADKMSEKVVELGADIGLALDGDADRLIIADETGRILDGDEIMAICVADLMERNQLAHKTLVATVMSNLGLEKFMQERGGSLVRTDVGDRYVMMAMREHGYNFGGEQSGHLIFHDYGTTGDGLLAALQILRIMREKKKKLSELASQIEIYPQVNVSIKVARKVAFSELPELEETIKRVEQELLGKGRVLVRYSGTENVCRVMVEASSEELVQKYIAELSLVVQNCLG